MNPMEIPEEHKPLLLAMGLKEDDLKLFDGKFVTYEFDSQKGVRLYDPYYRTSYSEYIDVDGWSSWSSENDNFMSTILAPALEVVKEMEKESVRPKDEEIQEQLRKKFEKK